MKTVKAEISKYQNSVDADHEFLDAGAREERILKYAPLVKFIANRMAVRLPSHISKEDLTSAGIVGLLDALDKFNPRMGIKFKTYAEHRIRGAILDELRKMDWIPRSVRKEIHRIEDAITTARTKLGREPEDFEVAEELGAVRAGHAVLEGSSRAETVRRRHRLHSNHGRAVVRQVLCRCGPHHDPGEVGDL